MADYGTVEGIQAYVGHMLDNGVFDANTQPTLAEVTAMLDQQAAKLNGWLAAAGYQIPVTLATAKSILDNFANLGGAGLAELTLRNAGYSATDQNRREIKFLAEFAKAEEYINSGAFAALKVPQVEAPGPLAGLAVGGNRLNAMFRRTSFGNNPTAESGRREP